MPGAFHAQRPLVSSEVGPADGGRDHPHRLRPARLPKRPRAVAADSKGFRSRFARLSELMEEAEEDVLSYAACPAEHWQKIWSNNPLERVNKEIKRRPTWWAYSPTKQR